MQLTANKARLMAAGLAGLLLVALCGALAYAWPGWRGGADGCAVYRGLNNSVVRFASAEEGRTALAADDEWIAATSELQRASLMGTSPPATREAFRAWQGANTRTWSEPQRARWCRALEAMAPAINGLNLPLPREILLVSTTGRESADTPHTRGNAIAIPMSFDAQGFSDAEVLSHELFHVVSRHAPALATRLYALIGFEPAPELEWPPTWLPLRIADADAPHHRHLMRLQHEGEEVAVMPLVLASHSPLRRGEVITAVMDVRLLRVVPGSGGEPTRALLRNDEPLWHEPEELSEFFDKLGENTDYTIHPEEAMADNFMFLVSGRPVPNPALLQRIESVLKQRAP